jgi:alkanesulfonate monooxygenase SsuD/methylene tetrahydromethanopterin reductase-like flavin-dependent oxidoreductase (luciferase family)
VQDPLPIWIGGNGTKAMRRAATLGDGWLPMSVDTAEAAVSRTPELATFEQLKEKIDTMLQYRQEAGGAPFDICFAPFERAIKDWDEATATIASNRQRYADTGVTWMTVVASARSLGQLHDEIGRFAESVIQSDPDR